MGRLLLLFVVLPAVELYLLIRIGTAIGAASTVGIIVITGIVGASLARSQGLRVLSQVQGELSAGHLPASSLLDGLMILLAGALLVTPGVLTDAFGFLCLVPAFRTWVKAEAKRRFERAVEEGRVQVHVQGVAFDATDSGAPFPGRGPVIDLEPEAPSRGGGRTDEPK